MSKKVEDLERELQQTRYVLGTLIGWLQKELGYDNAVKLLEMLNDTKGGSNDRGSR